jgi:hypothetical protein
MITLESSDNTDHGTDTPLQTRHPLASRTLSELQDIANAAESAGQTLFRADWTPFDWLCLVQFILTLREQHPWSDDEIRHIQSTAEIPKPTET